MGYCYVHGKSPEVSSPGVTQWLHGHQGPRLLGHSTLPFLVCCLPPHGYLGLKWLLMLPPSHLGPRKKQVRPQNGPSSLVILLWRHPGSLSQQLLLVSRPELSHIDATEVGGNSLRAGHTTVLRDWGALGEEYRGNRCGLGDEQPLLHVTAVKCSGPRSSRTLYTFHLQN